MASAQTGPRTLAGVRSLNSTYRILHAIAHPLRIRIIQYIHEHQPVNVNQINADLNIEQSVTSQHLRLLRIAGLVSCVREGKFMRYSLEQSRVEEVIYVAGQLAQLYEEE